MNNPYEAPQEELTNLTCNHDCQQCRVDTVICMVYIIIFFIVFVWQSIIIYQVHEYEAKNQVQVYDLRLPKENIKQ